MSAPTIVRPEANRAAETREAAARFCEEQYSFSGKDIYNEQLRRSRVQLVGDVATSYDESIGKSKTLTRQGEGAEGFQASVLDGPAVRQKHQADHVFWAVGNEDLAQRIAAAAASPFQPKLSTGKEIAEKMRRGQLPLGDAGADEDSAAGSADGAAGGAPSPSRGAPAPSPSRIVTPYVMGGLSHSPAKGSSPVLRQQLKSSFTLGGMAADEGEGAASAAAFSATKGGLPLPSAGLGRGPIGPEEAEVVLAGLPQAPALPEVVLSPTQLKRRQDLAGSGITFG